MIRAVRVPLVIATLLLSAQAYGYPHYRRLAMSTYGTAIGCELCHAGPGQTERSTYGKAWHEAGETAAGFAKLATLDADSDGVTNVDEIRAGSNPSDARSTPAEPGKYAKRAAETPIPRDQLELVAANVERFEAVEPTLDEAQMSRLKSGLGREPGIGERVPTIYLAVRNGRPEEAIIFAQSASGTKVVSALVAAGVDGKVRKIAVYRAAGEANALGAYAKCYAGLDRNSVRSGEPVRCPSASKTTWAAAALSTAVHDALWTIWAAFSH